MDMGRQYGLVTIKTKTNHISLWILLRKLWMTDPSLVLGDLQRRL
jgi:hypothetical protein